MNVEFRFYVPDDEADEDDPVGERSVLIETWMGPGEMRAIAQRLLAIADGMEDRMRETPINPESN